MNQNNIIEIPVHSTSQKNKWYKISIDPENERVECDCWGFIRHGHCRHIEAYKRVIVAYMHENPRVTPQKDEPGSFQG